MTEPLDLASVRKMVVLTGAGISVASGLRPFRGPGGLWEEHPEMAEKATGRAFGRDPFSVWQTFGPMRKMVREAEPNPAHHALAELEHRLKGQASLTVITQNVDGLHQRAGSRAVVEFHGTLLRTRCSDETCSSSSFEDDVTYQELPRCRACGAPLRPDVVLFDEMIPVDAERATKNALRDCDLFVAIGTSGTVSPASNFVRAAEFEGARTIFVNLTPMDPPNPAFDQQVLGKAEEVLPALFGTG